MWHMMGLFLALLAGITSLLGICLAAIAWFSIPADKKESEIRNDAIGIGCVIAVPSFAWALAYFLSYYL